MHSNTRQERLDKKFGGTDVKVKDLPKSHPLRIKRRKRIAVWTFAFILVSALVAPLSGFLLTGMNSAVAQEQAPASNPRADMWRAVRGGTEGYSAIKGPESGVLTQSGGIEWTKFRNGPIVKYAPWAILGMFLLILLYHVSHGKNRLKYDRSGAMVKRWSSFERFVHWTTAISFIILSITGLSMLLGKKVILPMLGSVEGGKAAYAAWTQLSMQVHNFVGPILSVGIVLMIVMWIWHNFPGKGDWNWIKSGGGIIGHKHPPAGRMNFGEKIWFWIICTFGLAVVISGLAMVAPSYPAIQAMLPFAIPRSLMQDANYWHVVAGLIWMTVAIGHIYIGTAGTEGAFEGMSTGFVSAEWAEQHHRIWFNDMRRQGRVPNMGHYNDAPPPPRSGPPPGGPRRGPPRRPDGGLRDRQEPYVGPARQSPT